MRFFRRSLTGLFLLALTLGLLAMTGQTLRSALEARLAGGGPALPARERVFSATVATATPITATPQTTAFGEIRARRSLELRAPRAGSILELAPEFQDGGTVRAGQMLLRLDPADATAQRDLARADLARAKAEARDADRALILARDDLAAAEAQAALREQALQRQRDLQTRRVGSEAAVETAALAASAATQATLSRRSALAQAEARVDQAATALIRLGITLSEAERALRDTTLFAQFDGVLSGVTAVAGRNLSNSERLGDLIDPNALEVALRLSTAQFARLIDAEGTLVPATITVGLEVSGAELLAEGRLERVSAAVGEGQSGRLVFASLTGAGGFRPGDFVTARVTEPALENVVVLPATAIGPQGGVLALAADDRLVELPTRVIRREGDLVYLAAEGLAGHDIVIERTALLGAGIKINPIRPQTSGTAETAATTETAATAPAAAPSMITLTDKRRAQLIAFVEANTRMPAEAKARMLAQLTQPEVPAQVIERLESRMGG